MFPEHKKILGMEKRPPADVEIADHVWENHRRLITTLYTSWSLEDVQRHLEQHHGFRVSKHTFKRKLQKWGVAKNAASDKMERVVESLKKTNERELTQPCPDKEIIVEGHKVTLSQVKRYMRRKKRSLASHADTIHGASPAYTNDDSSLNKSDTQSQQPFLHCSAADTSEQNWESLFSLTDKPSFLLNAEELFDLSRHFRRCSEGELYALTATYQRPSTSHLGSQQPSFFFPTQALASPAFLPEGRGPESHSDSAQPLLDCSTSIRNNLEASSEYYTLPELSSLGGTPDVRSLEGRIKAQEIRKQILTGQQRLNAAQESTLLSSSWFPILRATATSRTSAFEDGEDFSATTAGGRTAHLLERRDHAHQANGAEDFQPNSALKRPLPLADTDDDDQSRSSSSKRQQSTASMGSGPEIRLFACPYAKFDPIKFSEQNLHEKRFRHCRTYYSPDISRLKQHLYRVHRKPEHYCSQCFSVFETAESLDAHVRSHIVCEMKNLDPFLSSMSVDQMNSIKRRRLGESAVQQWLNIYKILFPVTPPPLSPFVDRESSDAAAELSALFRRRAPPLLLQKIKEDLVVRLALDQTEQELLDDTLSNAVGEAVKMLLADHDLQKLRSESDSNTNVYDPGQSRIGTPGGFRDLQGDFMLPTDTLRTATPTCTITSSEEDVRFNPADYQTCGNGCSALCSKFSCDHQVLNLVSFTEPGTEAGPYPDNMLDSLTGFYPASFD